MQDLDLLRIQQLDDALKPFRPTLDIAVPPAGWIRAMREALGMTNAQLAKRLGRAAPQSVEGLQASEALGTIKLKSLQAAAEAMGCKLVYALVPTSPIPNLRRERAVEVARRALGPTTHTMRLEAQAVGETEERRALDRHVERLLRGKPQRLWD